MPDSLIVKPEMGVSKNNGTPKWMVKIMENLIKLDDWGGGVEGNNWYNVILLLFHVII